MGEPQRARVGGGVALPARLAQLSQRALARTPPLHSASLDVVVVVVVAGCSVITAAAAAFLLLLELALAQGAPLRRAQLPVGRRVQRRRRRLAGRAAHHCRL
jgi:hypothetical protein